MKPGVSGRAEIVVTNLTAVLTVPIQAVTTSKGQQVCFVKRAAREVPVPVEVGLFNDRFIEIKSGLKEGDQVLLAALANADAIQGEEGEDAAGAAITNRAHPLNKDGSRKDLRSLLTKPKVKLSPLTPLPTDPGAPDKTAKPAKPPKPAAPTGP